MRSLAVVLLTASACATSAGPAAPPVIANQAAPAPRNPEPHTLADVAGIRALAAGARHVYVVTADGAIARVARTGGDVEAFADGHQATTVAVTDGAVWWIGERGLERAPIATGHAEVIPIATSRSGASAPYLGGDPLYDLVATGKVAWIGGGDHLYRIDEDATAATAIDALPGSAGTALAAGDGELVVAKDADIFRLVGGVLRGFDHGSSGMLLAVGGQRIATGWIGLAVLGIDGRGQRQVAGPFYIPRPASFFGQAPPEAPGIAAEPGRAIDAVAGGGGRLVVSISDVIHHVPREVCNSCVTRTTVVDGTSELSLITVAATLETVARGEHAVTALAVDAAGVVWATSRGLRAADR